MRPRSSVRSASNPGSGWFSRTAHFHQVIHQGVDAELRHVAVQQQVDAAEGQLAVVAGQADQVVGAEHVALAGRQPLPTGLIGQPLHEDARLAARRRTR